MTLRLLLGYDDSMPCRHALAYVAPLLRASAAEAIVVTAASSDAAHQRLFEGARAIAQTALTHRSFDGALLQALQDTALVEQPDLVVYGEEPRTWARWAQFQRREPLYATVPMSSLLVRGASTAGSNVLICAGGDASIRDDADFAGRLVQGFGARATILHVLSQVPLVFGSGSPRQRVVESFAATGAPEMAHMQAAKDALAAHGIDAEIKIRIGSVVEQVAAELNEGGYDLLVIGAHRSQGLVERFLLEDVAANILGKNLGPVLIVKQITSH